MATTTRYFRRKAMLAKIEGTYGVDSSPVPGTDYIEARNVEFTPLDAAYVANDPETPWYGQATEIPVSQACRIKFDVAMNGSGTAGTAPMVGRLLQAAAHAETLLAAAVTGTCQAGSTTTTLKLAAAGTSAVDDFYKGCIVRTTGGTGSGQTGYILTYNGTSKVCTMVDAWTVTPDNTTTYSIDAQAAYVPVSSAIASLSDYMYIDGLLHKLLGARGTVAQKMTPKGIPMFTFDFMSLYTTPTDTALVTPTVSGWKVPKAVNNVNSSNFKLHGFATNVYDLTYDVANQVIHRDDVVGVDDVLITERAPKGSVLVQAPLMADKDYYSDVANATLGSLLFTHGTAAGLRFRHVQPSMQLKNIKYGERAGISTYGFDTRALPTNGNDDHFFVFD